MIKTINSVPFLDISAVFEQLKTVATDTKLTELLRLSGVEFYDSEKQFVQKPQVCIVGFGGLSFDLQRKSQSDNLPIRTSKAVLTFSEIQEMFQPLQAVGGYFSYLNSTNLNDVEIMDTMVSHGHYSTLHLSYINIGIFGISSLVENEINSQRDMLHIARITEARTQVQSNPPVIVLYPEHLESYTQVLAEAKRQRSKLSKTPKLSNRDFFESANSLFPASKATAVIVSVTLRNLIKFINLLDDQGKEDELKRVLYQLAQISNILWPSVCKHPNSYSYTLPKHLE